MVGAARVLVHNTLVDVYCGAGVRPAGLGLVDTEELQPGKCGWVQLRLSCPAEVVPRDRFILRIPSPSRTIGAGEVIDVQPRYHRRFQQRVLDKLERQAHGLHGSPEELVSVALDRSSGSHGPAA